MKSPLKPLLIIALVFASAAVNAAASADYQLEIDHLLEFVDNAPCQINRNGKIYEANKAGAHIQKKYRYFEDKIDTSERFIELSATKSTMSGKYYTVKCGDTEWIKTQDWLLEELQNFREQGNS